MEKRKNIIFNTFTLSGLNAEQVYEAMQGTPYTDENGYGLTNVEFDENVLTATLIKRTSTFIRFYNTEKGYFEKQSIFIFVEVPFVIDFRLGVIYLLGQASLLGTFRTILRLIFPKVFVLSSIKLDAYSMYKKLYTENIGQILELVIQNFSFQNALIGKYSARIKKQQVAFDLINEYKENIERIALTISSNDGEEFKIGLSNNGATSITCDDESFEQSLNYLKNIMFK